MGNIQILTRYIRQKYGSRTRIILSEQGYTSIQNGKNVEKLQAAAIAYSYLISESDNMIDSLIIHRQVDHTAEIKQGLKLDYGQLPQVLPHPRMPDQKIILEYL